MKALRFIALGQAVVQDIPRPVPKAGECLVKVEAAGLCHTDLEILRGNYPAVFPVTPGHEFAGTVVETGPDVDRGLIGRRVAVDPLVSCGRCRPCLRGQHNLCVNLDAYGAELDGGLAEFVAVRVEQLYDVGGLAADVAALAEPLACATNGAQRAAVEPHDEVLVIGAGPIGLLILIAFRARGVHDLTVVEPQQPRRQRAAAFGAASTYASFDELLAARADEGFDVVVDVTGRPEVVQQAVTAVRAGGRLLLFGVCPPGSSLHVDPNDIYAREITVLGSFSVNDTVGAAVTTLRSSDLPLAELITHHLQLAELPDALSVIGAPESLKVQIALPD